MNVSDMNVMSMMEMIIEMLCWRFFRVLVRMSLIFMRLGLFFCCFCWRG